MVTICRLLGGLPLALRLVGGLLKKGKTISLPQFAKILTERGAIKVTAQSTLDDYNKNVEAILVESWNQLTGQEAYLKEVLCALSCLPLAQQVPTGLLQKLLSLPEADALRDPWEDALEQLQNLNLLERPDETHARLHPLIHEYIKGQCDADLPRRLCLRAAQTLRSTEFLRTASLDDLKQLLHEELPLLDSIISNDIDTGKKLRTFERCLRLQVPDLSEALDLHAQLFRQALLCGDAELAKMVEEGRPEQNAAWLRQRWSTTQTHEALRAVLRGHEKWVEACAFSPDGQLLASASWDNTVRLWEMPSGLERTVLRGHEDSVYDCAFSPDGQLLASASRDRTVRLWEMPSGLERTVLRGHAGSVYDCAFSPDGQLLASASRDRTVRLWKVASGAECTVLRGHAGSVYDCAFSPDGQLLASASRDRTVRMWEVASGIERVVLRGHVDSVGACAFSPDGQLLASGSWDKTVRMWEVVSGVERAVLRGHAGSVYDCAFSRDGQLLASASDDRTVQLWEVATLREILRLDLGAAVNSCAISSSDAIVLAVGTASGELALFDLRHPIGRIYANSNSQT